MKKLSFEKFQADLISTSKLKLIKGGDTAGGSRWSTSGGPGTNDIYESWSSDYIDGEGSTCLKGYNMTVFEACD